MITQTNSRKKDISLKHGDECHCPSCGAPGVLDTDMSSNVPCFENSIWFNPHDDQGWECVECCMK